MRKISVVTIILLSAVLSTTVACKSKSASLSTSEQGPAPQSADVPRPAKSAPEVHPVSEPSPSDRTSSPVATTSASAPPVPSTSVSAPPPIVVPRGTILKVRLVQALGSKLSQTGERFEASLEAPVRVHGKIAVPAGVKVFGTITQAHAAGRFRGGAMLGLQLNSVRILDRIYPIKTTTLHETSKGKGKRTTAMIGGGAGAGALIGGLAGGGKGALIGGLIGGGAGTAGAATGNRDITLPSETVVQFQMTSALRLTSNGTQ